MNDCPRQNPAYRLTLEFIFHLETDNKYGIATPHAQEVVHKVVHNVYLFQRGGIFYFRWKVPVSVRPVLGRTEIRYSLFTDRLLKAREWGSDQAKC